MRHPTFSSDGAAHFAAILGDHEVAALNARLETAIDGRPGKRLVGVDWDGLLASTGAVGRIAAGLIGDEAFPVRAVIFDKTADANWSVAWHQDRTIAVREPKDVDGFGPWSRKDGILHVAPPVSILADMVTLRLHLDDCDDGNGALKVAVGSHRLGYVPADEASARAAALPQIVCQAKAGDVWAYSTLILHASERSRDPKRRRVLQIDYAAQPLYGGLAWRGL